MKNKESTNLTFNLTSAILAFLLWGGWAFYINNMSETKIISAATQAFASFCITLILVHITTFIFHLLPATLLRVVLPAIISVSITGSSLFMAHLLAGTANIYVTIAPALTVAFVFCVYTALTLHRAANNKE